MPDNLESHTIRLLREMRAEMQEMRVENVSFREEVTDRFDKTDQQIQELGIAVAALSTDLKIVKKDAEAIKETGAIIEGRLVRIEKQMGYVKA